MSALLSVRHKTCRGTDFSYFRSSKEQKENNTDTIFPQALFSCHLNHWLFITYKSCCVLLRVVPRNGRKKECANKCYPGWEIKVDRSTTAGLHWQVAGDMHRWPANFSRLSAFRNHSPAWPTLRGRGRWGGLVVVFLSYSHYILYFF